ncbi:MAG: enoyl-ACP reductase [Planctomycetes bacterium]|nr:enoyl-ACP reductase [Planctomycetota bacterium]
MGLMDGKRGLVVGIANDRSYAYFIAESLLEHGATCLFTHLPGDKMNRRVGKAIDQLGVAKPWLESMDAGKDDDLDRVFGKIGDDFGSIDFLVHSIAFANRDWLAIDNFTNTPRDVYAQAIDLSAYTYVAMASRAVPLMTPRGGGSMIAMSYYGAVKAVPGYNVMGVAKAALESSTRYLAHELGAKNIRVNTISGGPLRTLSALAVGRFGELQDWVEKRAPLKRNVTGKDVGDTAVYLLSDLASGVTGQNIYVDCGYSSIGV